MRLYNHRMNRKTYLINLAGFVVGVMILLQFMDRPGPTEFLFSLLAVPRLHDIGRSGWWYLALIGLEFGVLLGTLAAGGSTATLFQAGGAFVIFALILLVVLGLIKGEPDANEWGSPTGDGYVWKPADA